MQIRVWLRPDPASDPAVISDRRGEPVTFGVPLPKGLWTDSSWRLISSLGGPVPTQTRVLDRWADGSARWALIDARVDAGTGAAEYFLEQGPPPAASSSIAISENSGSIVVETGGARFTLGPGSSFPFSAAPGQGNLKVTDAAGVMRSATVSSALIEERGPLRSVVLVKGIAPVSGAQLDLTARVHFFAGLPTVRVLITLTNPNAAVHKGGFWDLGDPGSILLKDASLVFALERATGLRMSPEIGAPFVEQRLPFELYQDSSGGERWQSSNHITRDRKIPTTFRGYRIKAAGEERTGLRATPIVALGTIAATVPHFWENFPMAIEAGESSLTMRLLPGQFAALHEIQGGEQKTYECFLSFGLDEVSDQPLGWARSRLVPCVDPEWTMSSGAVPFLAPLLPAHSALVNAAVEGPDSFERKRELIDEYGWRHFGEVYGDHESIRQKEPPIVSHYNNQYDTISGFVYQFLRTADPRWWVMAAELASHVIDIDVYHTTRDKPAYNHGLFWHTYHYGDADTATHRTYPLAGRGRIHGGGPSADHNYTTGLMLMYFLTGDEAARCTVVDSAQFVVNLDDGNLTVFRWLDRGSTGQATLSAGYYGPGRGPANSLNALVDGYRLTGEARFLAKAEEVLRRVVHPAEDISQHRLDDPEARWFYLMFLQSLGKYLQMKIEGGQIDRMFAYGKATLLHYARWMATHEHPFLERPEKLEFPTESWAAQDIRKSDVFAYAVLHATGEERAQFLERARFFHDNSVNTLDAMPTKALARPVIVVSSSGFMRSWIERHLDASAPAAPQANFRKPVVFVSQRERAIKRAKYIAAGAAGIGIAAIALLLFR